MAQNDLLFVQLMSELHISPGLSTRTSGSQDARRQPDAQTVAVLREHRRRQLEERLATLDYVSVNEAGEPMVRLQQSTGVGSLNTLQRVACPREWRGSVRGTFGDVDHGYDREVVPG